MNSRDNVASYVALPEKIAIAFQEPVRLAPLAASPRASPSVSTALGQGWQIVDGAIWVEAMSEIQCRFLLLHLDELSVV